MSIWNTYPNVTTLTSADEFAVWQSGALKNITFANLASEILDEKTDNAVWYAEVSATSGTVSAPAGGTLVEDRFSSGVSALCSTITTLSPPDDEAATEADGTPVLVTTFTAGTGAYVLSGTPSSWPVALIFAYTIPSGDYSNTKDLFPVFIDDDTGDVSAAANMTDNTLVKGDGGSKGVQDSGIVLSDADELSAFVAKQYNETIYNIAATGATETIVLDNGQVQRLTLDEACVITLPTIPTTAGESASCVLIIEPATFAATWAASPPVEWLTSDGAAPTLVTTAGLVNVVTFMADTYEGTDRWLGFLGGSETA